MFQLIIKNEADFDFLLDTALMMQEDPNYSDEDSQSTLVDWIKQMKTEKDRRISTFLRKNRKKNDSSIFDSKT
jgi:hypothetical protein